LAGWIYDRSIGWAAFFGIDGLDWFIGWVLFKDIWTGCAFQ
jgi:hypothetical protein